MSKALNMVLEKRNKFNKKLINGFACEEVEKAPRYLDAIIRNNIENMSTDEFTYLGYEIVSPKEAFKLNTEKGLNKNKVDISFSNLYYVKFKFMYKDIEFERLLALPYVERGGILKLADAVYAMVPVMSEYVISVNHDSELFVRLLKDKILFKKLAKPVYKNNQKIIVNIIVGRLYKFIKNNINDKIPILLLLFLKYGFYGAIEKILGVKNIKDDIKVVHNREPSEEEVLKYNIYSSINKKPRGMDEKVYVKHNIRFLINKKYDNKLVDQIFSTLLYSFDLAGDYVYNFLSILNEDKKLDIVEIEDIKTGEVFINLNRNINLDKLNNEGVDIEIAIKDDVKKLRINKDNVVDIDNGVYVIIKDNFRIIAHRTDNEVLFWKILLGKIIFKGNFLRNKLLELINDYTTAIKNYIDPVIKEKLEEIGIKINDFYDLLEYIFINYDNYSILGDSKINDIEQRYMDVLYYILYRMIEGINRTFYALNKNMLIKKLSIKEINTIFNSYFSSKKVFELIKSGASNIALIGVNDYSGNNYYFKITSVLEWQERGKGVERNSDNPFPKNMRKLIPEDLYVGSILHLSKKAPAPRLKLNPNVEYDEKSKKIIFDEGLEKKLDALRKLIDKTQENNNVNVLDTEIDAKDFE